MTLEKSLLKNMPDKVGVYLLKDKQNQVLYVGKALSIKDRLQTHFLTKKKLRKEKSIAETTEKIEFLLTNNEAEALILERNLIQQYSPPFNIRFKDDKTYPYLRLALHETYPSITITRELQKDGSRYFGPYSDVGSIRRVLKYAQRLFKIRNCKIEISNKKPRRPCINYQLDMCSAPCGEKIDRTEYWELVNQFCLFIEGKTENLLDYLKHEMEKQAKNLEFEKAKLLRDRINAIKKSIKKQYVSTKIGGNKDVIGIVARDSKASIQLFLVRDGNLIGEDHWIIDVRDHKNASEILNSFVEEKYCGHRNIPDRILVNQDLKESVFIEDFFKKNRILTEIITPKTESEIELTRLAVRNAEERLQIDAKIGNQVPQVLIELKEKLVLEKIPMRIEGIDVSNIHGQAAVGSLVTFLKGEAHKKDYRRYRIKTVKGIDDYAMIKEIIQRRFKSGEEDKALPDLFLIDGGKGHLILADKELKSLNISIPIISIAKKEEKLFVPGESAPLNLEQNPRIQNLIMEIRDEAHRFAIQYHKKLRLRETMSSLLEEIPGIGKKRKTLLLKRFSSIKDLMNASIEEISRIPSIDVLIAKRIQQFLLEKS